MENTTSDWLDGGDSLNNGTPEVPTSSRLRASQASPAAERADLPNGEQALPLLRLSGWESKKQYNKSNPAKGKKKKKKKKKKSATEAQKLQRAADAGLWTRVYERYRCRGKHCKQGPHCWPDERGDHHKLQPGQLEDIVRHIKGNMEEGEREEDVDIDIEIPANIL
ncbi:hypothetical protein IFR05_012285 [Cadophora sp. M221]|nr:hypothetical protein IFR05_012285 [Cadophora sp. M221]